MDVRLICQFSLSNVNTADQDKVLKRRWEPSKVLVSQARALQANTEREREPESEQRNSERGRENEREPKRVRMNQMEPERARESLTQFCCEPTLHFILL